MEGYTKICVKPTVDTCSRVGVNLFDISNNVWECQIRRLAKYCNNSYFVGSPESGVRFACLMSHFAISESTIWILWSIFVMCSAGSRKRQRTNDFFLKDNKKAFILWLNVPKVTAYR